MQGNLLIVEDDAGISGMVADYMAKEGYRSTVVHEGDRALDRFLADRYDLVLLDLMLPGMSGMDVLQQIRRVSRVPILIVSAKDNEVEKALGLRFGADDYIAKPFSLLELAARIEASIRRATQYSAPQAEAEPAPRLLSVGELSVDPDNFSVRKRGEEIKLTAKEFQILKLMIQNPTRVYTKAMLYQLVWNEEYYKDDNAINVHIRRLREKIEDDPSNPRYVTTLWGIGYRLGET
ncbi:response regulator transcription factor [Saccharibacillus sp. CPCC 101409]|uniref:response regulator transcription factor n=1 Tax=Saccharibacillus sp. CPCC 101409 TaxID=3058041 RepID=UPI002671737B|nr:response regulator transcription factor [Saccharibacillus sp. CPCC 101409]MDO3409828.1 response regulator transcription factor [Saccharibacillus sp. CPCC 101409]